LTAIKQNAVTASAPGKIIILGEHFVVHGAYSLAAAINKRVKVTVSRETDRNYSTLVYEGEVRRLFEKKYEVSSVVGTVAEKIVTMYGKGKENFRIAINSEIPSGSGLGSSAAVSIATTAALSRYFGHDMSHSEILQTATLGEKAVHGNPSGIDTAVSLRGGAVLFDRLKGPRPISPGKQVKFLIVYTGIQRKTGELVKKVRERKEMYPATFSLLCHESSKSSVEGARNLERANLSCLGALMTEAQLKLAWIGVSNREIDSLIDRLLDEDLCYGAKLTGAGGGGSVIALPKRGKEKFLLQKISSKYRFSFLSGVPREGLLLE
jgi:mevalonate kinase